MVLGEQEIYKLTKKKSINKVCSAMDTFMPVANFQVADFVVLRYQSLVQIGISPSNIFLSYNALVTHVFILPK